MSPGLVSSSTALLLENYEWPETNYILKIVKEQKVDSSWLVCYSRGAFKKFLRFRIYFTKLKS